jgi:hypothetical protein
MKKEDFVKIGNKLNEISRNTYTEKEMQENINIYWNEYQWSKANNKVSNILEDLIFYMVEDMDKADYEDTENKINTIDEMEKIFQNFIENI